MSARPQLQTLTAGDLDLLLSRSIDGDLTPEEALDLERYLELHPEARHRRDELAGVVQSLKDLPAPEPPFALATRVNSQVGESSRGLGSVWHRFGIYPPPAAVGVGVGVLALVVVLNVVLREGPPRPPASIVAERVKPEGPVQVFFQESKSAAPPAAPRAASAEPRPAEPQAVKEAVVADAGLKKKAVIEERDADKLQVRQNAVAGVDQPRPKTEVASGAVGRKDAAPATSYAPEVPAESAASRKAETQVARREAEPLRDDADERAEATRGGAPAVAGAAAPAPPALPQAAPAAAKARAAKPLSATVALVESAGRPLRWRLSHTPPPPAGVVGVAVYRLKVDASARVSSLTLVSGSLEGDRAAIDTWIRGLPLEPIGLERGPDEVEIRVSTR